MAEKQEYHDSNTTGMWKRVSEKGNKFIGGSFQNYWANYFGNTKVDKGPNDAHGYLYLYPKDKTGDPKPIIINMWKRVSKKGIEYLTGKRGKRFNIYTNTRKKSPIGPDYNLVVYELDQQQRTEETDNKPAMPSNEIEDPGFIKDPDDKTPYEEAYGEDDDEMPF